MNTKQLRKMEPENTLVPVPYLPKDCIFNIIVHLPIEYLLTSRFVCKSWHEIVNSPAFINAHLRRSEIGLIFLAPVRNAPPGYDFGKTLGSSAAKISFSVESRVSELQSNSVYHWPLIDPPLLFCIKFMEIKEGQSTIKEYNTTCVGKIRATCNGLIVLENRMKKGGLVVMNPITRDLKTIPFGTRSSPQRESYGLGFLHELSVYKLVHLFKDDFEYICCEIMNIGSRSWREVNGPPNGLFGWLGHQPVFAIGALHWVPRVEHNEYLVSMPLHDEKFRKVPLPYTAGVHDRVFEMDGFLGFASRQNTDQIDVWTLRSLGVGSWEKQYSIIVDGKRDMVPLYCSRICGEIVFKCKDNDLYAYDHHLQVMRKIEVNKESFPSIGCYFPHVNSLISM